MDTKQRKTLARKMIKEQDDNVKQVGDLGREITLEDGFTVCFQEYQGRLTYLGERDPEGNFS